jgi:putative spermidine/putrescine transport system substrate-binding protein
MQTKKYVFNLVALLVIAAFVLTACGTTATPTAAPATVAPATAAPATAAPATTAPATAAPATAAPATAAPVAAPTINYSFDGTGVAQGYKGTVVSSVPADLLAACKTEGMLTIIATPPNWANYGEIFADFEATTGVQLNSLDPNAGSADELAAIVANKGNKGPQAPDIVDVGYAYGAQGVTAGDYMPYVGTYASRLPATTLGIPTADSTGLWSIGYFGIMVIETNTAVVQNPPKNWSDLLLPAYKGQVALAGDPQSSNQAIMAVYAAALANGGSLDNAQPGLDFFKKLNDAGNFVPVIAKVGTLAQGATPIELAWNYNALGDQQSLNGNPPVEIDYPSPSIGGAYVQAISAYAPHPNCAKVWMEVIHSDQGQIAWIKGGASVVSQADMQTRNVIPADVLKMLPDPKILAAAVAPTVAQLTAAKTLITGGWLSTVGVAIPTPAP